MLMGSPRNYKIRFSLTECTCQSLVSQNEATGASTGFESFRGQRCQDWETQQHPCPVCPVVSLLLCLVLVCLIPLLFINEFQIQLTSLPGTTSSAAFVRCLGELSN